ncbi:hypothetical protein MMU07_08395 [Aquiflexum sp. LQ15W]|uniref:hypothetical protein n=1 Tax=Cognataquiflexum nitidum TaxID=2922272 RepID=UPI001F13DEB0|nr:hypothetical protein [Cognataquiflexum nitidum]MCH6199595.1 hypothetical protein [Cognataquiflexum nitidum]
MFNENIDDNEFLFRGVVNVNWDFENDRPSSATFKDSFGVSVDRDGGRSQSECVSELLSKKNFIAICKVLTYDVREIGAIVKYLPIIPDNVYHSEIHDSIEVIQLKGKKPNKIRDKSLTVFKK